MDLASAKTTINLEKKRFELNVGDSTAIIDYILNKQNVMYLTHTEVPGELEGKGIGHKIVREALDYIEQKGYRLAPLCPFVAKFIKKHPEEYRHLLADGFNV
jgi:hypothetical protein